MATKFKVKRSTVSGVSPTTGDIDTAELAINLPDRKLFTSNGTAVYELGSNLTNLSVSANLNIGASGDIVLVAGAGISANGSLGTAGHVLHSNGTSVYWAVDDQGVTSVATGNGLTGGTITSTGTVSVLANNGITANTTGLYVTQGTGTVVNTTGVHVNSTYIGTLTANNATNLNGQPASYYTNATNLASGTVPTARLGSGTANSTTFLSGDQSYKTAITSVATGSGLTGGTITTTGTVSVLANNGLSANATGVYVVPGNGLVTANSTGVHVGAGSGISVNSTAVAVLANSGVVANATGVYVNTTYIATLAANSATGSLTNTFTVGTASYFVANGNLGIGNTTPAHKLRVQGDISLSGGIQANGSLGTAGQVLTSNSTGVYWSSGGTITAPVRETFVANSTVNTTFTVTGGYSPGIIDVYRNGVKMVPGTDVDVSSGTTITLTTAAANGDTVEVVGYTALSVSDAVKKSGDTMTANLIMSSNSSIQVNNLSIVSPANTISVSANLSPATGNTYDLGSTSARWRNIYTNDLNLSNGLGDYTIVEGEDDLFLYNNKKGKVYKFALIEVKPEDAPKKIGE